MPAAHVPGPRQAQSSSSAPSCTTGSSLETSSPSPGCATATYSPSAPSPNENCSACHRTSGSPHGLDEPELAAHYRGAAAVFLPVIDGTASNALLEAMAAGCPVVCPRLPGFIDDYLGDDEDSYRPGDVQSALDALERTADTARRRRRAGLLARRAHHFDWSNLRQRFIDAYGAVGHREPIEVSRQPPDPVGVA